MVPGPWEMVKLDPASGRSLPMEMEPEMKFATWAAVGFLAIAANLAPTFAEAKSVKWYCVALNPLYPQNMTCYPSTSRP